MIAAAPVGVSVAPAHVSLAAGARTTVLVRGRRGLVLRASVASLTLDGHGRPVIAGSREVSPWIAVHPRTNVTGALGASFVIAARRSAHARPGDHSAILLVTALAPGRRGVAVGIRLGVVVTVRVPGHTRRRLSILAARSHGRLLSVTIANRGDVIESIGGAALKVELVRGAGAPLLLRAPRRRLLPRTRAVVAFRLRSSARGAFVVRVTVTQPGGASTARRFPLRL